MSRIEDALEEVWLEIVKLKEPQKFEQLQLYLERTDRIRQRISEVDYHFHRARLYMGTHYNLYQYSFAVSQSKSYIQESKKDDNGETGQ